MATEPGSVDEDGPRVVLVTHPREGADAFARRLVEARLAACVNRLEVRSTYRWQGAVQDEPEVLLVLKTVSARWAALQAFLAAEHPYEVPECVALAPAAVEARYLSWLVAATRA